MAEKVLLACMTLCVVAAIGCVVMAIISPTCEERGGVSKFSHFQTVIIGKGIHLIPIYSCEGATK